MPTFRRNYDEVMRVARALPAHAMREARMSALCDALWREHASRGVSWVGFYLDRPGEADDRRLILGPRRDKPACSPIGLHGACGRALLSRSTLIVRDVRGLGPGYIACDPRDQSELVIPLCDDSGTWWGVLDLDSFDMGAFDEHDAAELILVLVAAGLLPANVTPPAVRA
ncbi:MAG: GAF domain-containing protein [Phycisphaeraceae bacterium]|nr:GAF domain-containing protein [Phycisphaerales bacterium]QOJ16381.1 MAG: GAF domain-containing protein [Phycisphaeraceae bacterium]